ncbi:MAG: hypothetical protein FWC39_01585 [Bacteroidetes bacterium]|nr:hypothetical protein [Bacteroidota bacterium]
MKNKEADITKKTILEFYSQLEDEDHFRMRIVELKNITTTPIKIRDEIVILPRQYSFYIKKNIEVKRSPFEGDPLLEKQYPTTRTCVGEYIECAVGTQPLSKSFRFDELFFDGISIDLDSLFKSLNANDSNDILNKINEKTYDTTHIDNIKNLKHTCTLLFAINKNVEKQREKIEIYLLSETECFDLIKQSAVSVNILNLIADRCISNNSQALLFQTCKHLYATDELKNRALPVLSDEQCFNLLGSSSDTTRINILNFITQRHIAKKYIDKELLYKIFKYPNTTIELRKKVLPFLSNEQCIELVKRNNTSTTILEILALSDRSYYVDTSIDDYRISSKIHHLNVDIINHNNVSVEILWKIAKAKGSCWWLVCNSPKATTELKNYVFNCSPDYIKYYLKYGKFKKDKPEYDCYIATACYGSVYANEVDKFREYRDNYLVNSWFGRNFIAFYYFTSPPIAKIIAKHEWLKIFVRENVLAPILKRLPK